MGRSCLTFGSLFTGIGGIDLGLERAGMECRWQIEIDTFCLRVLAKHWPEIKRYGDIRSITGNELEPVDLICGGFPCQDLSQAGKRAGIEGTRSGLWFEFARLVGRLGPRWVLIENVPGLLVHDAMRRVIGELARRGYVGCWRSLRASEFGASHLRKRVFIVAYRPSRGFGELRKPPRSDGFPDRSDQELADSGSDLRRKAERITFAEFLDERGRNSSPSIIGPDNQNLADAERTERRPNIEHVVLSGKRIEAPDRSRSDNSELADAARDEQPGLPREDGRMRGRGVCQSGEQLADAAIRDGELVTGIGTKSDQAPRTRSQRNDSGPGLLLATFAPGPADLRWPGILAARPDLAPALESQIRGMADGLPDWMDRAMSDRTKRLGRLGNAVVPDCAEWIGRKILEFEKETFFSSRIEP